MWLTVVPAVRFLLIDAVWRGTDRDACLAPNAGHAVGACWPYRAGEIHPVHLRLLPRAERWRVNLTFILAALLLLPLLIPRLPAKSLNAGLFFIAFPVVAFFLLHGGGLGGFGISWTAGILSGVADAISEAGPQLVGAGAATAIIGPLLVLLGKLVGALGFAISMPDLAADSGSATGSRPRPTGLDRPCGDRGRRLASCCSSSTAASAAAGARWSQVLRSLPASPS